MEFPLQHFVHYLKRADVERNYPSDTAKELLQAADPHVGGADIHLLHKME